ncbi:MAG: class II aldolase/adducin family protein [Deltaproteobacteria bacterium]|nr:class II aldolase/adducin family protein [Deltaproteobacteria bacterium]MBI2179751.1 class II aldolase/adducin family protein [Deltaproteobacteria bacterium]MBI2366438.1 class II aldolase/adducin family protein [Deltaproteobacteria bacterium]MBI2534041.1 class II aldolase/adducin family protein [Deltaproteobacteria bacterium]MBI3066514.1 class II aldolase/adducin family protein [Deltaproteobacteria bacterium]
MAHTRQLRKDIVSACRILSQQKLVEGFGHVSARIANSARFIMTPRISLALVKERDLLTLNLKGEVVEGSQPAPSETWLHVALMKAKPEVNAITRIHARVANMFSVTDRKLEPVHNHGSFFSGGVPVFYKPDLITTPQLGAAVAETLGDKPAVLLRGNGQVTVGRTIAEAVMMAIYLEEAAEILYGALQIGTPIPLTGDESARRRVEALPPVDLERAWKFFKSRVENV